MIILDRYDSMVGFVRMVLADSGLGGKDGRDALDPRQPPHSSPSSSSAQSSGSGGKGDATVYHVQSQADWDKHCSEQFKGICALAFTSHPADDSELTAFQAITSQLSTKNAAFRFLRIETPCHPTFSAAFDVISSTILPSLVAYSPSKKRFATYRGPYKASDIKGFYESVLAGSIATTPITSGGVTEGGSSGLPVLSDTCAVSDVEEESEPG